MKPIEWRAEEQEPGHVDHVAPGRAIVCSIEGMGTVVVVDGETVIGRQRELSAENGKLTAEAVIRGERVR